MPYSAALSLCSYRRQHILTEYASFKHVQLQGIYVCLSPGDQTLWSGVIFVRKGPYSGAVLRFSVEFPERYPMVLPLIVFLTEMFHPLVASTLLDQDDVFSSPTNFVPKGAVPSGSLNIEHGKHEIDRGGISIVNVLLYLRRCLEDEKLLDTVPFEAALNFRAWHAWQAYRGHDSASPKPVNSGIGSSALDTLKHSTIWSNTVEVIVQNSIAESAETASSADQRMIHFVEFDDEELSNIRAEMQGDIGSRE